VFLAREFLANSHFSQPAALALKLIFLKFAFFIVVIDRLLQLAIDVATEERKKAT